MYCNADDGIKEIGGYFELHVEPKQDLPFDGLYFNSGRSALEYYLLSSNIREIWLPEYICPVLISVIKRVGVELKWYQIDEQLNPLIDTRIFKSKNISVLIVNYFGIRSDLLKKYYRYRSWIIWDLAQAFYCKLPSGCVGFYSPRKFFGIPDGGVLFGSGFKNLAMLDLPRSTASDKILHLIKRLDMGAASGYGDFKKARKLIGNEGMRLMSKLALILMQSIDYAKVSRQRLNNYELLHKSLKTINKLILLDTLKEAPLVYPLMLESDKAIRLREHLIKKNIFIATYWPFQKKDNFSLRSHALSNSILPLPLDQRYGYEQMKKITISIDEFFNS